MPIRVASPLILLALAGCAAASGGPVSAVWTPFEPPPDAPAVLEPVLAFSSSEGGVSVRLPSNGCTYKADVLTYVVRRGPAAHVAFARRKPDLCPSYAPVPVDVTFMFGELGLPDRTPVFVLNPLAGR
jgi:hypothetical protein